jgi:hypothetical protein
LAFFSKVKKTIKIIIRPILQCKKKSCKTNINAGKDI